LKDKLKKWCLANDIQLSISEIPYGEKWILKKLQDQVHFNFYTSGKWLIQGKDSKFKTDLETLFGEQPVASEFEGDIIGSDESGKGDYFGPLVVACFLYQEKHVDEIKKLGAKDSKKLNEKSILDIAKKLKKYPHSIIALGPHEYNFIYEQDRNLNRLLAKLHADAIHGLAKNHKAHHIVIDQFAADPAVIKNHFKDIGIPVTTKFRAEETAAVACASILARAHFVESMKQMEKQWGQDFPKGASMEVEMAAEYFIKKHGVDKLAEVAKLHFVTTQKILQPKLDI
jgi:ribonuclease HIII